MVAKSANKTRRTRKGSAVPFVDPSDCTIGWAIVDEGEGGTRAPMGKEEIDVLSQLHKQHEDGQGFALFEAMEFCMSRALEFPNWVKGAFHAGLGRYRRGASHDLNDAFNVRRKRKRSKAYVGEPVPLGRVMVTLEEYVSIRKPALTNRKKLKGDTWSQHIADEIKANIARFGLPTTPPSASHILETWKALQRQIRGK